MRDELVCYVHAVDDDAVLSWLLHVKERSSHRRYIKSAVLVERSLSTNFVPSGKYLYYKYSTYTCTVYTFSTATPFSIDT